MRAAFDYDFSFLARVSRGWTYALVREFDALPIVHYHDENFTRLIRNGQLSQFKTNVKQTRLLFIDVEAVLLKTMSHFLVLNFLVLDDFRFFL